jgi:hypothetical protein
MPPVPEAVVVVTTRQTTMPTPHVPSVTGACSRCGSPVWLSYATAADLAERPGSRAVCEVCVVLEVDEGTYFAVSDRVRAELRARRATP